MNVWKIASAGTIEKETKPNPVSGDGLIRVRVTKVLMGGADAAIYAGKLRVRYPLVPGRYAVGFVADDTEHPLFPKGTRVLLRTFRDAEQGGTAKRSFDEEEVLICGQTCDGFLRDFVLASPDDITPLPSSVSDEQALLVHHIALAKAAIDRLGARKGQHVAVIGANVLGYLLCQLLIYQQAAPILIDTDAERLAFAKGNGVYYTLPADENLLAGVGEITGGRLVSGAVYVTTAPGNERELPFLVSARGSNVVLCGPYAGNAEFDLVLALKKQLTMRCVWNCADYVETAINLIANRAVDLDPFRIERLKPAGLNKLFKRFADDPELDRETIFITDLV